MKEGGKVYDLNAFRERKKKELPKNVFPDKPELVGQSDGEVNKEAMFGLESKEHGANHEGCLVCEAEREGIPILAVYDHYKDLTSKNLRQESFNPRQYQEWMSSLRTEDLMELSNRMLALTEEYYQTHPTYTKALAKAYGEKLRTRLLPNG